MHEKLTPELLLQAYRAGVFPMAEENGEIYWYSPDPRCIFEFDRFRVSRSLRQIVRRKTFEPRVNTAFDEVIRTCAERAEGTWISDEIIAVYTELHRRGYAHSVESWQDQRLVGGLYGVAIGGVFFGESMFHRVTDASKVALVVLVERLKDRGFGLLDVQWSTAHLESFGAVEIPREEYLNRLERALALPCRFAN